MDGHVYNPLLAWYGGALLLLAPLILARSPALCEWLDFPKFPETAAAATSAALDLSLAALSCAWFLYPLARLHLARQPMEPSLSFLRSATALSASTALIVAVALAMPRPVLALMSFSSCSVLLLLKIWKLDFLLVMQASGLSAFFPAGVNALLSTPPAELLQARPCRPTGPAPPTESPTSPCARQAPRSIQGSSLQVSKATLGSVPCACVLVSPLHLHRL